ncbi:membrane morphogenesis protein VPS13 [Sugiyamaella lignohabitans]|uniref:Membrane morphogenesis protein VPS13 n=1 Tax=Sugiyamaella lignohabitans TaxID=796027 RepID=A0A167EUY0_9ASCO|nr:membrane morphogenesis protein VPS13 [Sugiyamaella lignohabitans]ANB14492.1 membrane morphogenesis protein VPS13 [Sugiyamaella lignohabitans]
MLPNRKAQWSAPFNITNTGRTYVKVFVHGKGTVLLKIDVLLENSTLFLYFDEAGNNWPYSIRNFSKFEFLFYQANPYVDDQGVEQHPHPPFNPIRYKLPPKSLMSYAWDFPAAPFKELVILCNGKERRVQLTEIGNLRPMKLPRTERSEGGIIELHVVADGPLQSLVLSDYDASSSIYKIKSQSQASSVSQQASSSQVDLFSVDDSVDNDSVLTVTVQLEGVGVSLINRRHVELCYMTTRGFEFKYKSSELYETFSMKVKWIQIDNQLYGGHYDVILFPSVLPKSTREMENHPTFSAMVTRVKDDSHGVLYIKYASVLLQQMTLEMDEDFLFSLLDFARDPNTPWTGSEKDILCDESSHIPEPEKESSGEEIYIEVLHIHPAQMDLSFVRTERINVEDRSSSPTALNYFVNILTMAIGNINDAPVKLNALLMENVRTQMPVLIQSVESHYSQGFLYQVHKILGSADFIGNPVGLFNNISSGFVDMFYEPYNGFMLNDRLDEFGIGLAKGGFSFMKKSIFGISDSVYKVTGSISKGLSVATLDREFQSRRRINMARNRPRHALYGLTQGATSFFDSVTSGVSGLALAPMEGAAKEGASGFFKGLGKGIVGLPTKTAIGFFDLASNLSEGVRNTTTVFDGETITRIRPARFIAQDGIVRPYSQREAVGQQWLKSANSGRYFKDEYLAHINMTQNAAVVIVTTTRIITLFTSNLRTDWEVRFDELRSINRKSTGLTLILRPDDERREFFIPIGDQDSQRFLFKEISTAVKEYNRRLQTIS